MTELSDDVKEKILIDVLLNAKLHDGKPNAKVVMGGIMGKNPDLRSLAKQISPYIAEVVADVSSWEMPAIESRLNELAPDAEANREAKKEAKSQARKEQKKGLPELPNAEKGKVRLRYAPDPSKYPHLGQGMNYLINHMYREMYDGWIMLRFDDTNPEKVDPIYFDAIKDGMNWLGCTWNEEVRASAFLDDMYDAARDLLSRGEFYFCSCTSDEFNARKDEGKSCPHRDGEGNLDEFNKMVEGKYQPGEGVIRMKGELTSDNLNMRDPVMFRLSPHKHALTDATYVTWPLYDFESAFFEARYEITHVIRSGEFGTMRQELQSHLIKLMGGTVPEFVQFGRFNIQGSPTSGRVIRELVQKGIVQDWDDLRLLTLQAVERRGLHPDTARMLIQAASITPKSSTIAWVTVESVSRQLLDREAPRLFMAEDPIKVVVADAPEIDLELEYHPDLPDLGKKSYLTGMEFWISGVDADVKMGDLIRLKDLYNIKITGMGEALHAEYAGDEILKKVPKIQWVEVPGEKITLVNPQLLYPSKDVLNEDSLLEISGYIETSVENFSDGRVVQLERVGFAKINHTENGYMGHFVHKF
ncbi:MAG: glutamate--tRNA ligase family protein [Candidatus Kariarchaeaceae archaeon]|jgi:glutamyl-tRNA synthetase